MSTNTAGERPTLDQLREAVAAIIGSEPDAIPEDANLLQLGVDSLGMMRLVNRWRREGIRVSSRELAAQPTLAAWQRHIDALRSESSKEQMDPHPDDGVPLG
jgi:aryl carrier-like protein